MIQRPGSFERTIFVCTLSRTEGHHKPSCGRQGGSGLRDQLKMMVEEKGLEQSVKVLQSGCLGGCEFGPAIMTFPDNKISFQVRENDLEKLLMEVTKDLPEQPGPA